MKGQFLIADWLSTPWALRREVMATHARVIAGWVMRPRETLIMDADYDEPRERITVFESRRRESNARVGSGGIAVIPVFGTIVQRAGMMTEWSGGTSTQQISAALREAMADDTISQVLLEIDSPGGSVYGISELADEIIDARKSKPVVAIANSMAASAAYWIGASASEFHVTPGGEVGSIGVWTAHEDWSKALDELGVKTTLISAGKYKTEGNPVEPLSSEARDFIQSRVDGYYQAFVRAVARGRGVGVDDVRNGMGQGRTLSASAALEQHMVDSVTTIDALAKQMRRSMRPATMPGASRIARAQNDLKIMGCASAQNAVAPSSLPLSGPTAG